MKLSIFSVYDSKANAFIPPFVLPNEAMAKRVFADCANDPNHNFCKWSNDFNLFMIGEFDDISGTIEATVKPVNLGLASAFKAVETLAITEG